jgi:hypothetical protein
MTYTKSKSTKRFNFQISRDWKSHKVGANTVSIVTSPPKGGDYYTSRSEITMTVKEARAFQKFLNTHLDSKPAGLDSKSV